MPWLLNLAYLALITALTPLWLYRRFILGKGLGDRRQKLWGMLPERRSDRPCIWLHAVSVGEVTQLRPVLASLIEEHPGFEFLISTTTRTAYEVAQKHYPEHTVCYFPLDFSWAVSRALDRVRPTAIVLVELELWPNFILAASKRGIPLSLINGRITERSMKGYRWIRPLMRRLLRRLDVLAIQNETYAARFRELGADRDRLQLTGSIKFDRVQTSRNNPRTEELRRILGIRDGEAVLIAGSTQAPEEKIAVETYRALRKRHPRLRLIVVPRHRERFEEVAELMHSYGEPFARRSRLGSGDDGVTPDADMLRTEPAPMLLLDTLGELSACWGLADIAFVGGSLGLRGGQNMIEPAAYGAAVLFGPNTHNFRDVVSLLLQESAACVVHDQEELTRSIDRLLADPLERKRLGERAQRLVLAQQGATARTVKLIDATLKAA